MRLAERIALADHHLAAAIKVEVGAAGLGIGPGGSDLEHDVGGEGFRPRGDDFGPLVDVLLIGMAGRLARPGLDDHLHPCLDQWGDGGRDQRHAPLAGVGLTWNCDNHGLLTKGTL